MIIGIIYLHTFYINNAPSVEHFVPRRKRLIRHREPILRIIVRLNASDFYGYKTLILVINKFHLQR